MAGRVGFGGDVGDDEPADAFRVEQGELHGGLAAHGMSQQMDAGKAARLNKLQQVFGHDLIIENIVVRRKAMVSLVNGKDLKEFAQPAADGLPIIQGAEEAMQDDEWKSCSITLVIKPHEGGPVCRAWRCTEFASARKKAQQEFPGYELLVECSDVAEIRVCRFPSPLALSQRERENHSSVPRPNTRTR